MSKKQQKTLCDQICRCYNEQYNQLFDRNAICKSKTSLHLTIALYK